MFENLALNENGFLFDARTGNTYTLNRPGTFILREMIDGTDRGDLAARLEETFDVDAETALRDVEQFLFRLSDLGILADGEDEP